MTTAGGLMSLPCETTLLKACRTLFGHEVNLSRDFLYYLQPSGAKSAFRNLAKAHHPDRHTNSSAQVRRQHTEHFREVHQAYELICEFLEKRPRRRPAAPTGSAAPRPTAGYTHRSAGPAYRQRPQPQARPLAVPAIPMEFGMYSYYQGKVTYRQLIEALVWQRRQRPALGVIAQKWGWLSEAKVAQILGHRGQAARFGSKAVELGHLKPYQVDALLRQQRSQQQRIGQYFIDKGWLTESEAQRLAQDLDRHNSQIGRRAGSRSI